MKKILAILLLFPLIAFAQTSSKDEVRDFKAICLSLDSLNKLLSDFDELPYIHGKSFRILGENQTENELVIFVNPEKNTWTIVEKVSSIEYCVVAAGGLFAGVPEETRQNLIKKRQKSRI